MKMKSFMLPSTLRLLVLASTCVDEQCDLRPPEQDRREPAPGRCRGLDRRVGAWWAYAVEELLGPVDDEHDTILSGAPRQTAQPVHLVSHSCHQVEAKMSIETFRVSTSGQMSLPAAARHRWHLDDGGEVDVIDLGFGVLTVPAGQGSQLLNELLPAEAHYVAVRAETDPDLMTT